VTATTEALRPWAPDGLGGADPAGLSYILVDEIEGRAVGLAVSDWPRVDGAGRLRFGAPPVLLGADRHSLEEFVNKYRETSRRIRSGDVFAAHTRPVEEGEARLEPMLAPEQWIDPPVYDVTADARDAAKASFSAAVTATLGPAEVAELADLIQHPAAPPPPPPPPPPPASRPWWRSPLAQVAAAGVVFVGGLGAGFASSAVTSDSPTTTIRTTIHRTKTIRATIPTIVNHTVTVTVGTTVTGPTEGTTTTPPATGEVVVPDVVGLSEGEARSKIADAKLTPDATVVASDKPKGEVVSQNPPPGRSVEESSAVRIRISAGPTLPEVPDVLGLDEKSAIATLNGAGFNSVSSTTGETSDSSQVDTVIAQSPEGGTPADPSTLVKITIGVNNGGVE